MSPAVRAAAVVVILFFAYRGKSMGVQWPVPAATSKPTAAAMEWSKDLGADSCLPADRAYYSSFYHALEQVVDRDGLRTQPVIDTTEKFARFQAGSLDLAIDQKNVGKYEGLGRRIDNVFKAALGDDVQAITPEVREKLKAACAAIAWRFAIHGG